MLDGVDDYVELPNESMFDLDEFTIMATIKITDYEKENWIISKGTYFGNYTLRIFDDQTTFPGYAKYVHQISGGNWSSLVSDGAVPVNNFINIAVTVSSTEFNSFINGELIETVPNPTPPLLNNGPVIIGGGGYYSLSDFFKGVIDEIRIYNVTLSATEIRDLHALPLQAILDFFDASVDDGSLVGEGPGNSAEGRLDALRNMIETAGDHIEDGEIELACNQLAAALIKCDGLPSPPDFVTGDAASVLAILIQDLMTNIGCG